MEFEEFDVTRDQDALRDLVTVHHSRMTPTLVIDGQVVVGFDPRQLDELLAAG